MKLSERPSYRQIGVGKIVLDALIKEDMERLFLISRLETRDFSVNSWLEPKLCPYKSKLAYPGRKVGVCKGIIKH